MLNPMVAKFSFGVFPTFRPKNNAVVLSPPMDTDFSLVTFAFAKRSSPRRRPCSSIKTEDISVAACLSKPLLGAPRLAPTVGHVVQRKKRGRDISVNSKSSMIIGLERSLYNSMAASISVESSVLVSTCPFAIMRSGRAIYFLRVSSVLTTSSGIMDHEEAHRKHLGGKILGYFF
ncbi:unnamed protein product [Fasciola hepatica]|uniref:Ribosomal protein S8 n=1 Tax=Fasciola hepatica TaxID=6192 RepID=A0ABC9HF32_FASHE